MTGDKFSEIISDLLRVESQFRRNGFDKEMGKDPALFVALANTLICVVDDLNIIYNKQSSVIENEVSRRVAEELDKHKSSVKVVVPKRTSKKIKLKVKK
tara:strand:+ start:75073 stop:75369 length:297 start_codon:yes stop_codon:yes gene_type:complete